VLIKDSIVKIQNYLNKNRFKLFEYSLLLSLLTYFITYTGMVLLLTLVFIIIVFVDANKYEKLKPEFIRIKKFNIDPWMGAGMAILPFINYYFNLLNTVSSFGTVDISFVLIGLTIFFYGIKSLKNFYLAVGFDLAIIAFGLLMGTPLFVDFLGPKFIEFTIYFSTALLRIFGYHVIAGPDYFILPNGQRIYMLVWCSGIESFTLFTLLMIVLLIRERMKWWVKLTVITIGAIGDLFVNVIRVAILIAIAIDYGMSMMETFHSHLGDLLFLVYVLIFYWVVVKFLVKEEKKNDEQSHN